MISMTHALILLSGGKGTRFGSDLPKQYISINGLPVVLYSFLKFLYHPEFTNFVIVAESEWHSFFKQCFDKGKREGQQLLFARPGARRQDSLLNGFSLLSPFDGLVAIHDGARPFISSELIDRTLHGAKKQGAAAPAMPVSFTVKKAKSDGTVEETIDRATLREIQTPQILTYDLLKNGLRDFSDVTDDLMLVERMGHRPLLVSGERWNLKITHPEDLELAQWIIGKLTF
jgi:2-C-methyl-D-erythritol 4-phosphate cytidylyltransferase